MPKFENPHLLYLRYSAFEMQVLSSTNFIEKARPKVTIKVTHNGFVMQRLCLKMSEWYLGQESNLANLEIALKSGLNLSLANVLTG